MKCTMMKRILALLSLGLICIPKEPEAFTFAKMEVGHPVISSKTIFCLSNSGIQMLKKHLY